jgi:hypothetical protein
MKPTHRYLLLLLVIMAWAISAWLCAENPWRASATPQRRPTITVDYSVTEEPSRIPPRVTFTPRQATP